MISFLFTLVIIGFIAWNKQIQTNNKNKQQNPNQAKKKPQNEKTKTQLIISPFFFSLQ